MQVVVDGYGLHRSNDLVFLHEDGEPFCLNAGLEELPSPFSIRVPPRMPSPHRLPKPVEGRIPDHPLVWAMGPMPSQNLLWVDPQHADVLDAMQTMVPGPISHVIRWWVLNHPFIKLPPLLNLTNAAPLCIVGYQARDFQKVVRIASLPRTRSLIVSGHPKLPGAIEVSGNGMRGAIDWPAIGAAILYRFIKTCEESDYAD